MVADRRRRSRRSVRVIVVLVTVAAIWVGFGLALRNGGASGVLPRPTDNSAASLPAPWASAALSINSPALTETTKRGGLVAMVTSGVATSAMNPFGAAISLQDGTVIEVQRDPQDGLVWVAVDFGGDVLSKVTQAGIVRDYAGTVVKLYSYRGLTTWIGLDVDGASLSEVAPTRGTRD